MPEGPGGDFEALCQLLAGIPRDGEHNSELWTTVDKDKTNVRAKAVSKLIVGFSLYLILCAKNFQYCSKGEARYCDFLIVCNVMCSSAPPDLQGITMRGEEEYDSFEAAERALDKGVSCRGVISNSVNEKNTKKGDKPSDEDQKLWAPLHYFCYWISGISVGMMNKMASWNMLVDYGFKEISDYLYSFEKSGLQCLINEVDHANCSRYYESYLCRCIADTTLKKTFMGMVRNDTASKAVFDTTRSLSYEAIHLSMLPVLHERLVSRLIQFEPLLGMATIGLCLNVPVVPIQSLLQFFDGQRVENIEDFELIKKFYHECSTKKLFMNRSAIIDSNPGSSDTGILSPYITCPSDTWDGSSGPLREKININGQQQAVVNENGNNNNNNKKGLGTFSEYLQPIAKKLYAANEKVLNSSALVREFISFQKCIESLQRPYDMREFVGGMSKFNNMKFQMQSVQVARSSDFPENSMENISSSRNGESESTIIDKPDPIVVVGPRSGDVFCICIHAPSILFWFSIMGRPRRDNGIVVEAAHNLVKLAMTKIPKSIFPYEVVPMTRLDHISKDQVLMDFRGDDSLMMSKSETLIRYKVPPSDDSSSDFRISCEGRGRSKAIEDEMYMRSIFMISKDIGCAWNEVPIQKWKLTIDLAFGVTYPFVRYKDSSSNVQNNAANLPSFIQASNHRKSDIMGYLFMNPSRRSAILYTLPSDVYQDYMEMNPSELEENEWSPYCNILHEFSVSPLKGTKHGKYTRVNTMDEAIENIFSMGFGPCPFYRRTGVLISLSDAFNDLEEEEEFNMMKKVGCIVSHKPEHGHGCSHCDTDKKNRCYLCPQNPFQEVYLGSGRYVDELAESKRTGTNMKNIVRRILPIKACESVVPIGSKVLLSIHSLELLSLVGGDMSRMSSSKINGRKRPRYRYGISGAPKKVSKSSDKKKRNEEVDNMMGEEEENEEEILFDDPSNYILAVVDICRNFNPMEGMAFVRIKVVRGNNRNTSDSRGLFVKPGDIKILNQIGDSENEEDLLVKKIKKKMKIFMDSVRTHVDI